MDIKNGKDNLIHTEVLIIGGGQSGMAMAQACIVNGLDYIAVDANNEAGASRKNRYDSLSLFTPAWLSSLPGLSMKTSGKRPTKDEMAMYLQEYEVKMGLKIIYKTKVDRLETDDDGTFFISTVSDTGETLSYRATSVVIATGPFKNKRIPNFASKLDNSIKQIHSSEFTNAGQLGADEVLVVGGGNSGFQIVNDLDSARKKVLRSQRGRFIKTPDIFITRVLAIIRYSLVDLVTKRFPCHKISPVLLMTWKEVLFGKKYTNLTRVAEIADCYEQGVIFPTGEKLEIRCVVRCTGYKNKYPRIHIEGALGEEGTIVHDNGVTTVQGLYTMDCIGRIDSSARVARTIVREIETIKESEK